ncbi:hypothetical protein GRF29_161g132282 [Pseudopithomyces chartarum]|uniref:Uncharacterized protein n=1 Tax=Pseudopithomyces chartarum TaxID=1892770 RepID=A0AAN6LTY3_9PLEO|nr:hypothetical protein GRF29_161g132282 [Pseudopithomyces chartarum]
MVRCAQWTVESTPMGRILCFLVILWLSASAAAHSSHAHDPTPPPPLQGLVGYGIAMYEPACAFACQRILQKSKLNCSTPPVADRWHGGSGLGFDTSDECYASDNAYLLSLAPCLHQYCEEPSWILSRFWSTEIPGHRVYEYEEALELSEGSPFNVLVPGDPLDEPRAVIKADWSTTSTSMHDFARNEAAGSKYALILFFSILFVPLLLTATAWLLFGISTRVERWCIVHIIYPPLIHRPWPILKRLLGENGVPTRGQTLLGAGFAIQNLLFCILGHNIRWPNIYYDTASAAFVEILANRTGHLSFANLAGLILYGTRNNPLITITGWSHNTYLLLHRWIAYACIGHALAHTIIYFILHLHVLSHKFTQAYWNVGFVAIAVFVIIGLSSISLVRRSHYELFLDVHILMSLISLVACYYHIIFKFSHHWGYENWIAVAALIWLIERLVRVANIARNGRCQALCTQIHNDYLKLSVQVSAMTGTAYLYFPTKAGWRIWESHPFSIAGSITDTYSDDKGEIDQSSEQEEVVFDLAGSDSGSECDIVTVSERVEENSFLRTPVGSLVQHQQHSTGYGSSIALGEISPALPSATGSTMPLLSGDPEEHHTTYRATLEIIIRRENGATARLFAKDNNSKNSIPVLVEGPYSSHANMLQLAATSSHVMCIAGGVGITAILPLLRARSATSLGRTSLYFGTRTEALVKSCDLYELQENAPNLDIHIRVGARWQPDHIVQQEMSGVVEGLVVTCGPPAMVANVRLAVLDENRRRKQGIIRLVDEHFSW